MSLYTEWRAEIDALTEQSEEQYDFWQTYCTEEAGIYKTILANKTEVVEGVISELADQYHVSLNWFTGFLDGISESLKTPLENLETLEASDSIRLEIDFEKLYWSMLAVPAEWLYNLPEWDNIFTEEKRKEITKAYKRSKTVVNENKVGRNDPCPCGSGKKYKKCCGR